ncbi:MAG: Tim44/TimA family putative adaptor protein [Alphaproteobacteria bacterium]|nr:Tim44/TimA family putative adaptor protein [Alphaproteobacteria bacterium]
MTYENIILGIVILYLIYKIGHAIRKTARSSGHMRMLSTVNGRLVELQLKDVPNSVQMLSSLVEQDFSIFAKMAFSRISQAFAAGHLKEIKNEITPKVFQIFQEAIAKREANNQHMEYTLISFLDAHVTCKTDTTISVEFTTEQINLLKDDKQQIIEGDPMYVATVKENWTFEKQANNNWVLCAVKAGEGQFA